MLCLSKFNHPELKLCFSELSMSDDICFCFGRGILSFRNCELTIYNVMKNYFFVEKNLATDASDIRKIVVQNIKEHFLKNNKESDILITDKSINDRIKKYYLIRERLKKNKNKNKIYEFQMECRSKVINIGQCECKNKVSCYHSAKQVKVRRRAVYNESVLISVLGDKKDAESENDSVLGDIKEEKSDDFVPKKWPKNSLQLKLSAEIADRYNLSDRAYGAITSGVLADVGLIESNNPSFVVDKNFARRSRLRKRKCEEKELIEN